VEDYDSDRQLAVVKVDSSLDVYCVRLNHGMDFMPHKENIAAIGRDLFGNLIVTTGLLSYDDDEDAECLVFSDADKCSEVQLHCHTSVLIFCLTLKYISDSIKVMLMYPICYL
jgi:hypothetical protein